MICKVCSVPHLWIRNSESSLGYSQTNVYSQENITKIMFFFFPAVLQIFKYFIYLLYAL